MTIAMRIGALVAAASLALALAGIIALDSANAAKFNEQVSGSFIDTSIDTNGDGMNGSAWTGQANGNGSPNLDGFLEVDFAVTPAGACDAGHVEGAVVEYSMVRGYDNGSLLFSRLIDGTVCFDPATGIGSVDLNATLTGGTGNYAGATGTYTLDLVVHGLVQVPGQAIAHGAFSGTSSG